MSIRIGSPLGDPPAVLYIPTDDGGMAGVQLEIACKDCGTQGEMTAPEWVEWNAAATRAGWADMTAEARDRWEQDVQAPRGPEIVQCGECDGAGWLVTPAGRVLLGFLRRHNSGIRVGASA